MTWKYSKTIKAILFAKDGTLIDFNKTWGAITAAGGDPQLTDILLDACGMAPLTGKTRADSMFAAANANEIAQHMVAHGSPLEHGELLDLLDQIFIDGAEFPWPMC